MTFTYNFQTSQKLTEYQLDYLNDILMERLPTFNTDDLDDIPEWTTEIELVKEEEKEF